MTPELKARIAKDGLFRTTRLLQLEKRAAMPQSSTFYHPRRTSGVAWIQPVPPVPSVEEPIKPLSILTIDSEELGFEDEAVPLDGEVCEPARCSWLEKTSLRKTRFRMRRTRGPNWMNRATLKTMSR